MESKDIDHNATIAFLKEIALICLAEGKEGLKKYLKDSRIGERVRKALRAVMERRIIRAVLVNGGNIWFYNGKDSTHLIIPFKYCSCMDFLIHTVSKSMTPACYHLIAQVIAETLNNYITLNLNRGEVISIINEINTRDLSITLKRKIQEIRRSSQ